MTLQQYIRAMNNLPKQAEIYDPARMFIVARRALGQPNDIGTSVERLIATLSQSPLQDGRRTFTLRLAWAPAMHESGQGLVLRKGRGELLQKLDDLAAGLRLTGLDQLEAALLSLSKALYQDAPLALATHTLDDGSCISVNKSTLAIDIVDASARALALALSEAQTN